MGQMGAIMGAAGVGTFLGNLITGAVSDGLGRKTTLILTGLFCFLTGLAIVLMPVGTSPVVFGVLFFIWGGFGGGHWPLYLGTLPVEAVPHRVAGTAIGVPTAVGEIIGAGVMPAVAGALADAFDLYAPMWMACIAALVAMALAFLYVETAPRAVARMKNKPTKEDHIFKPFRKKAPAA